MKVRGILKNTKEVYLIIRGGNAIIHMKSTSVDVSVESFKQTKLCECQLLDSVFGAPKTLSHNFQLTCYCTIIIDTAILFLCFPTQSSQKLL